MDGAPRLDSLGVSSSVAEGVLTPAALHLRVSAEVDRQAERRRGVLNGPMSQTSFQSGYREPSSAATPNPHFRNHQILSDRGAAVKGASMLREGAAPRASCRLHMRAMINYRRRR